MRLITKGMHLCDGCGKVDVWGPTWGWYGSWVDYEAGRQHIAVSCSVECQAAARLTHRPSVSGGRPWT